MDDSINYWNTPFCPYCKKAGEDTKALRIDCIANGKAVIQCKHCGQNYFVFAYISPQYSSKKDCEINGLSHQEQPHEEVAGYTECKICKKYWKNI